MNYADDFDSLMLWLFDWCMEFEDNLIRFDGDVPVRATRPEFRQALKENPASFDYKIKLIHGWIGEYGFMTRGFDVPEFLSKNGVWPAPPIVAQLNIPIERKHLFSQYDELKDRPEVQRRADIAFRLLRDLRNELLQEAGLGLPEEASPALAAVKAITITPHIIPKVVDGFSPYLATVQRGAFERLLLGETIDFRVHIKAQANQIVDIFLRLKENGYVNENKQTINDWLCQNITYQKLQNQPNAIFLPYTVKNVLSGKNPVSKASRLPGFEWLPLVPEKKE